MGTAPTRPTGRWFLVLLIKRLTPRVVHAVPSSSDQLTTVGTSQCDALGIVQAQIKHENRPKLLDLFCGAGGAAMGYHRAGFDVVGVDIAPQPHYPFEFHQTDALEFVKEHGHEFDAIHASPPCQAYSLCQRIRDRDHPQLVEYARDSMTATGIPWVIENVEGAPLRSPVTLCGSAFPELRVYRHRLFETSFHLSAMSPCIHRYPLRKMGRPPAPGEFMHVVGNFSGVAAAREAMGISWMARDELREAIPPAYTEYVGKFLLLEVQGTSA